ncbi:MAG TPA: ferritin-like domain-containing protein [Gemmatimonadales bacterium]|nr:ferritin-like domain-containing protein [Gemmatimonadales bacterium]
MPSLETLQELLVHELQDLYNAENQIMKALPKMAKKATSNELREAFQEHLGQTEVQAQRLERALALLDAPVRGRTCDGMQGIIEEGKKLMEEEVSEDVLDAGLIAAAQKVEHYEIASYGSVKSWAELLGQDEITALLQETLDEEEETDRRLSEIAESVVNAEAALGADGSDESSDDEGESGSRKSGNEEEESDAKRTSHQAAGRGRRAASSTRKRASRNRT